MGADISKLSSSEAHRIVANWISKNHMSVSYKEEIALRDVMVEFANADRKNVDGFLGYLRERFPKFYSDVMA